MSTTYGIIKNTTAITSSSPVATVSNTVNPNFNVSGNSKFVGETEFTNAVFNNITIGNQSLNSILEKIEERLAILHFNPELETRWDNLRKLREQYIALEKALIEQEKVWEKLNK